MNAISFADLKLLPALQRALAEEKYHTPTPIQAQAIPHLLEGRDLIGCAQTGTGKTAAFALPILERLDRNRRPAAPQAPRVLVLSPTRELAAQIAESFAAYGRHLAIRQTVIYGGVGQGPQVRQLRRGVHVLIATPGRLLDLYGQGHVRLDRLDTFVLDEADRMLDMGFLPDLKRIIALLPKQRHSLFFSATMPSSIAELAASLLTNPVRIEVTPPASTVERIRQRVMFVRTADKRDLLERVLDNTDGARVLVFTRTKHGADKVARQLSRSGHTAAAMHGNKSQAARTRTLGDFRHGAIRVLVATDVAARGIDVDGISHVINYDLPHEPECYVHRIGRTGRAGATGEALSFCDSSQRDALRAIEKLVRRPIEVDADHPFHATGIVPGAKRPEESRGHAGTRNGRRRAGRPGRPGGAGRPGRPAATGSTAGGRGASRKPQRRGERTPATASAGTAVLPRPRTTGKRHRRAL